MLSNKRTLGIIRKIGFFFFGYELAQRFILQVIKWWMALVGCGYEGGEFPFQYIGENSHE
ncbi:MAG: hypothetical protein GY794_12675 [bacterium]|nr:hypothetical protein [bacterium]